MILFLRFRRATLLLTRGMSRSLRHQQALEASFVGMRYERRLAQVPLPFRMLLRQDVALVGVVTAQPAGRREPDALAQRTLRFLLGHCRLPRGMAPGVEVSISGPAPSTCCGPRASGPARSWPRRSARSRPGPALRVPGRFGPSAGPGTSPPP